MLDGGMDDGKNRREEDKEGKGNHRKKHAYDQCVGKEMIRIRFEVRRRMELQDRDAT